MVAILILHTLAAFLAPFIIKLYKSRGFLVLACVPAASFGWVITHFPDGNIITDTIRWIPELGLNIVQRLTPLAAVMSLVVLGIGALVLAYCSWYFRDDSNRTRLFAAELTAFSGVMFGLVTSDNLLMLFIFWELTTVLSFLLVGYYPERALARRAASQALLVTTSGGLVMLCGIIMVGQRLGSYSLQQWIASSVPHEVYFQVAVVLILIGALCKSALMPLHFWLPGAMVAPTPVSAYLHSAAMVKAGVFLVGSLSPLFASLGAWRIIIIVFGLISMIYSAWLSLQEYDLKLILAYGTISQLGFLTTIIGCQGAAWALAGLTMLIAHACFKSTLFMVVGIIDHSTHTRDIRKLAGLGAKIPYVAAIAALGCISMAGLPFTLGFLGKEAAITAAWNDHSVAGYTLFVGYILGSMLTCAYTFRFFFGAFSQKRRRTSVSVLRMHMPAIGFYFPPAITALAGIIGGLNPAAVMRLVQGYAASFSGLAEPLSLWRGFTPALLASISIWVGGALIAKYHSRFDRYYAAILNVILPGRLRNDDADTIYQSTLKGLDIIARAITAFTQRGSLPVSLATIFISLISLTMWALFSGERTSAHPHVGNPLNVTIIVLSCLAAIAATMLRNRLAGALVIGATGYGCVAYFGISGAPDLALTQAASETLLLAFYVLGVRRLGGEISGDRIQGMRWPRAILGLIVGATITIVSYFVMSARQASPLELRLPDAAYRFSHGINTVNVILVDIRGWDTFGESVVLLLAATGVVSLVFRNNRYGMVPRVADAGLFAHPATPLRKGDNYWLESAKIRSPKNRSLILEVTTRSVFPSLIVFSLFLLFSGHNHPGGGFVAGLIAGAAFTLRYVAGGRFELGETLALEPGILLGGGLIIDCLTAGIPMFFGYPPLTSHMWQFHLPIAGTVSVASPLFFDIGIFLIVLGVVFDILRSLGVRLDFETALRNSEVRLGDSARVPEFLRSLGLSKQSIPDKLPKDRSV